MHYSSVILFVVAKCTVKVFDDVDVFATECHFGVSGTISFLIQFGDFVVDQTSIVKLNT